MLINKNELTPAEFTDYINALSLPELSDLSTELYFSWEHSKDSATVVEYNQVIELYNKKTGRKDLLPLDKIGKESSEPGAKLFVEEGAKKTASTAASSNATVPAEVTASIVGYDEMNTCNKIISLSKKGLSNKEIIDFGFNKSTVNRQVGEYKKKQKNG